MAELEDNLNAILSNPEAMDQIVSIAKALTGGGTAAAQPVQPAPSSPPNPPNPASGPDLSALMGLLGGGSGTDSAGGLDPALLQTAVRLFSEYSAVDDRKVALLNALKPFLKPERYAKIDRAVQIAKLARVIRVAFQIFQQKNGEERTERV